MIRPRLMHFRSGLSRSKFSGALSLAMAMLLAVVSVPKILLWNVTPSVPVGLYFIDRHAPLRTGSLVVSWLPHEARVLADQRHYLPSNVPLIKPVIAMTGQRVCRLDDHITVDGIAIANALKADSLGRPLPRWNGCIRLSPQQVMLINPAVPASFDGRYFGPSATSRIIGQAVPILTRSTPDGRFIWHLMQPTS